MLFEFLDEAPNPFGWFVEYVDGSYPMPNPGEDGDADERLLREDAAARRALSMALLAISTAADDCHIEEEEKSFMVMVWIYRIATTRLPSTLLPAVYRARLGLIGAREREYRSKHEHDNILIFSGMKYELETRK